MGLVNRWQDRQTRPYLMASGSLAVNLAFALAHGGFGLWTGSTWYLVLAAYYGILGVMRFGVLRMGKQEDAAFLRRFCGWMLIGLSGVLAQTVVIDLYADQAAVHHRIIMIALATFTFCKGTLAIINAIRARQDPRLRTLRNIACADAAASMVALQRSMIITFGGMAAEKMMNALMGGAACLLVLFMGLNMVTDRRLTAGVKALLARGNRKGSKQPRDHRME